MNQIDLKDRVAIITGGARGIGFAIAERLLQSGAHVCLWDVDAAALDAAKAELSALGRVHTATVDITSMASVDAAAASTIGAFGKIDILVNNAGIAHIGTALTTTEEDMDRLHRVNIKGVHACAQAALTHMTARKNGVILNMCSIAAQMGLADRFAYSMTKGAVLMMTYSIAKDFIKDGIRCNCIAPARVHTPFVDGYLAKTYPGQEAEMFQKLSEAQPIGRMAKPDEIAALALYLCSDEASFATGTNYTLDGGAVNLR
jgi:NAD(P)-dependent dehydrogenase (short-subunit alcohol dehydrogenase family)